jgi:hypothetical protein
MVLLGLLLMLGCTALAVDAVVQNTSVMHAVAFNQSITNLSLGALFVAGAVVGLLFALGLAMFAGGLGRGARRRRERRLAEQNSAEAESLRVENARLEQQLAANRESTAAASPYPSDAMSRTSAGRHRSPA